MPTLLHKTYRSLLCLMLSGCVAAVDLDAEGDDPAVAVTEQAITGGTRASISALPDNGVVRIYGAAGTCTGTLLTNRWVLTADHCFCQSNVTTPGGVAVSVYGSQDQASNPATSPVYTTYASQVIRHGTYDVALVKLKQTLPYTWAPLIYTGDGNDLVNLTAHVFGFGHNRFVNNVATGAGESEYFGDMRVNSVSTASPFSEIEFCSPQTDNYWLKSHPGPRLRSIAGTSVSTQKGDSGSGAFIDSGEAKRVIGVLTGNANGDTLYTGIWHIRDWIKQQTGIWTTSECGTALPSSLNSDKPAIGVGPDNKLHAVALFSDRSIGHWSSTNGKSWSYLGKVPNALTDTTPALSTEIPASGQTLRLGLAFRNPTTQALTYSRWTPGSGWSQPVAQVLQIKGGLGAHRGLIAFIGLDNRVGVTGYQSTSNTFIAAQWAPVGSPAADATRGISAVFDQATSKAIIGYRTSSNQWVQMRGDWSCPWTYLCAPEPAYSTDWGQASLARVDGDRVYLETVRTAPNGWPRHERRAVDGAASYDWGWSHYVLGSQAVTDFQGEVLAMRSTYNGSLFVSPVNNCWGNPF